MSDAKRVGLKTNRGRINSIQSKTLLGAEIALEVIDRVIFSLTSCHGRPPVGQPMAGAFLLVRYRLHCALNF